MKISIIVPNYNGGGYLTECLKSIYTNKNISFGVTIVDNNSADNSQNKAKSNFPQSKLIQLKKNEGFAQAVNQGIRKTSSDCYLILNNDTKLENDTLLNLLKAASDEEFALVGGKIIDRKGNFSSPGFKLAPCFGFQVYDKRSSDKTKEVDWISGCAMLVKKEVFDKIGLFDEKFFFYFEDTDFCIRARKAGFRILYEPRAVITHLGGASSKYLEKNKLDYFWYQSKFRNIFKNGTSFQILFSLFIQAILFPYKLVIAQNGLVQLKSLFWAYKNK